MLLKRFYKLPEGWVKQVDKAGNCLNPPPLDYISVGHTGAAAEQNFSTRLVAQGVAEGWIRIAGDNLTLIAVPETLVYTIKRGPGAYCCHCGERLDAGNVVAQAHIAEKHPGKKSPDPDNPAGYKVLQHYECALDSKQHEKYRVKKPGRPPVFARKGASHG